MKATIQFGCCVILAASALAGEQADTAKKQAQQSADAQIKKDYATVVSFTHPVVIKAAGGKEALIKALEAAMKQVAEQGVSIEKTIIRGAEEPKKVGTALVSLVTQEVTVRMPDGKMVQESILLGYSYDGGKKWVFADTADMDEALYHRLFPELKGVIKLPAKKEPVTTKDK